MSHWNYRVVQSFDGKEFFIAEVYYDDDGHLGWADNHATRLKWDDYEDLKGTVEMIQRAFDKPLLRVARNDYLVEVAA